MDFIGHSIQCVNAKDASSKTALLATKLTSSFLTESSSGLIRPLVKIRLPKSDGRFVCCNSTKSLEVKTGRIQAMD